MKQTEPTIQRLKNGEEKQIGFRKKIGSEFYYSKDLYSWSGTVLNFISTDMGSNFRDKNNNRLFANDAVKISAYPDKTFVLHYDSSLDDFMLFDVDENCIFDTKAHTLLNDFNKITKMGYIND